MLSSSSCKEDGKGTFRSAEGAMGGPAPQNVQGAKGQQSGIDLA